ncbi:MAG: M23 family metallopeptidase [Lachnospiraceae bacterium]
MKKRSVYLACFFFLLLLLDALLEQNLRQEIHFFSRIQKQYILEEIREEELPLPVQNTLQKVGKLDFSQAVLLQFACGQTKEKELNAMQRIWMRRRPKEYQRYVSLVEQIWKDVKYFPVPESKSHKNYTVSFADSWMEGRTFGGKRGHEGCDILADVGERNLYPVVSMTDGVVEKLGWLTLGGYRIGIRAPSGGYFYYAHLASYEETMQEGKQVKAGELLGFMGDTGYGNEGTIGQFPVHLHVGIYISDENLEECSVNPYWILKSLEKRKLCDVF